MVLNGLVGIFVLVASCTVSGVPDGHGGLGATVVDLLQQHPALTVFLRASLLCAVEYLARVGFDPVFGARPVKRALQRELQTLLAKVGLKDWEWAGSHFLACSCEQSPHGMLL